MKRKKLCLIGVVLVMLTICSVLLTGCGLFGGGNDDNGDDNTQITATEYTIQYTDDNGTHILTVTDGSPYSLEVIPERTGYMFMGLFDAEVGGTQYVLANGSSITPFTDKKNIVLFPQYAANEYTIVLDYQGAAVTGQRSLTVKYNEKLPELPKNLAKEHSVFVGWYTEENCGGTQVADAYGLIPDKSTLNERLFNIEGAGEYLYLYAGFEVETFIVTFNFGSGIPSEEVEVEYNTPIADIIPDTRNSEGHAVLSWSKTSSGGQIFTGNITDNTVLYAVEWAPVIELDLNGGKGKNAVVVREGSTVALPTPVRVNYKFLYWETMSGDEANITSMPGNGAQLKAVWQAMLVFDENGGMEVDDISQAAGTLITLPSPTKVGYIFAGWYTSDKTQYTSTSMPAVSVELKAGWYEEKEGVIIQCSGDSRLGGYDETSTTMKNGLTIDFSEYLPEDFSGTVKLEAQFKAYHTQATLASQKWISLYFYSSNTISDTYKLWDEKFTIVSSSYDDFSYSLTTKLNGNKLYGAVRVSTIYGYAYISDYRIKIVYPDTTKLYL